MAQAFGDALRAGRKRLGLNQQELADQAGVSVRTVRDLEHGRVRTPRAESVRRIRSVLDLVPPPERGVRLAALGPVEATRDGKPVDLGSPQARLVLALLAVNAGRAVAVEEIVDLVWGGRPPRTCRSLVQTYVSRLRKLLGAEHRIERIGDGYLLRSPSDLLDVARFTELVDGTPSHAALGEALDLWRGTLAAELRAHPGAVALARRRVSCALAYSELAVRFGGHDRAVPRMQAVAHAEPLHEAVHARLMLALAASGHRAAALRIFGELRSRLAAELGISPGPDLRSAQHQVLQEVPLSTAAVPGQLPSDVSGFTGRAEQLGQLDEVLAGGTMVISAIGGIGGIGKTWLALHWAHRRRDWFPDGQLYVNLRGFDPTGPPVESSAALVGFLEALRVPPNAIPADLDAQAALFRNLVSRRRMLVLLDNAHDLAQIRPLLPGGSHCTVLITSRNRLGGLVATHGAHLMSLDALPSNESRTLLVSHLAPGRVAAEPDGVRELVDQCAGLPLALGIIAARAAAQPTFPLAVLAAELRETSARLDALDAGDLSTNLRAVFDSSCQALTAEAARVFRLLGLAPGADIGLAAAASLTALPVARLRTLLRELGNAHLVQEHVPGRYRMHDLVRLHAGEQVHQHESELVRLEAQRRLVDFFVLSAYAAEQVLRPHEPIIPLHRPRSGCVPFSPVDEEQALAWFTEEEECVIAAQTLAAQRSWHTQVWQAAVALTTFQWRQGHIHDHVAIWRAGLTGAQRLGSAAAQGFAHRSLGYACTRAGLHSEAVEHTTRALTMARQDGDLAGQAHAERALAEAWEQKGGYQQALDHSLRALHVFEQLDNQEWRADALNAAGWCHSRTGQHSAGRDLCERALALFRAHRDRPGQAVTLDSLGHIAHHTGQYLDALRHYNDALDLYLEIGHSYQEANTWARIGDTQHELGNREQATEAWQRAVDLYLAQHRLAEAEQVRRQLP
ncbi:BTAD domain-containing putative transcriptional regulator [Kutzneria albida]|uniref:Transcription regulator, SARP family n=1 Tax=Kutzneria albida DSM 43870 TaxID=1449976 RepID=W5W4W3_9PSEU|nr:BTAD domain-containing putative transcriptional regulator [Kutzneria albida]AHH95511.1 transcription regulator, SARP family [Kutzneria albida DSM 43870]